MGAAGDVVEHVEGDRHLHVVERLAPGFDADREAERAAGELSQLTDTAHVDRLRQPGRLARQAAHFTAGEQRIALGSRRPERIEQPGRKCSAQLAGVHHAADVGLACPAPIRRDRRVEIPAPLLRADACEQPDVARIDFGRFRSECDGAIRERPLAGRRQRCPIPQRHPRRVVRTGGGEDERRGVLRGLRRHRRWRILVPDEALRGEHLRVDVHHVRQAKRRRAEEAHLPRRGQEFARCRVVEAAGAPGEVRDAIRQRVALGAEVRGGDLDAAAGVQSADVARPHAGIGVRHAEVWPRRHLRVRPVGSFRRSALRTSSTPNAL